MVTNKESDPAATPVRPAATLVLMRASEAGPEVLLTIRPKHLRFMGGAAVFPGGAVAPADHDSRWEEHSAIDRDTAAASLPSEDGSDALGAYVCALRESFEEVGFLIGSGPVEAIERADADDPAAFLKDCIGSGVVLTTDRLVPAGRWVTPLGSPIRFDTCFFLVEVDRGWEPIPDPNEVDGCMWVTPGAALAELASGSLMMAPPTVEMLQRLDAYDSVPAALDGLKEKGVMGAGHVLSIRLSPLVHVVLAPNPGLMTGPGTNTYIVGSGPTVIIDPALDDAEYVEAVLEAAGDVDQILVTHRHPDHIGGAERFAESTGVAVRAWGDEPAGSVPVDAIADGETIEVGGAILRALHTPGHASDHLCFYLDGAASLFAGDNILGEGTAVIAPPDGDMGAFLSSLRRLAELHIDRIYPGHFRPLDGGNAVIEQLIEHRLIRESMILESLASGPLTIEEIVERVYVDTPAQLHPVARYSVQAHLEMLGSSGRVSRIDDRWRASS